MTKPLPELLVYLLEDMLEWDVNYTAKPMFWWYGVYYQGQIFAIYAWDVIYMKVGDNNKQDYIDAWSEQFVYHKNGKPCYLSYFRLPEEILEDSFLLHTYIKKSLEVSQK